MLPRLVRSSLRARTHPTHLRRYGSITSSHRHSIVDSPSITLRTCSTPNLRPVFNASASAFSTLLVPLHPLVPLSPPPPTVHPIPNRIQIRLQPHQSARGRRSFHSSSLARDIFPFKLFDIGEGITEVEIVKWEVEEGQRVEEFDTLCEVQSDKSSVELTAPATGWIQGIRAEAGQTVAVGQVLCDIRTTEEDAAPVEEGGGLDDGTGTHDVESDRPNHASITAEEGGPGRLEIQARDSAQVNRAEDISENEERKAETAAPTLNENTEEHDALDETLLSSRDEAMDSSGGSRFSGEGSVLPSAPIATPPPPPSLGSEEAITRNGRSDSENRKIHKASPAVRTLANKHGVDLGAVKATGEGGRITRADVESAVGVVSAPAGGGVRLEKTGSNTTGLKRMEGKTTRVEFGRTRKVMWKAMGGMGSVPHFGYTHSLNLTPLLPYMKALNPPAAAPKRPAYIASDIPSDLVGDPLPDGDARQKTTLLTFLVKGLLLALEEHPIMRAKIMEKEEERWMEIRRDGIIAVAVSDPKFGLVTPSLPALPPSTPLNEITSHLSLLRQNATRPSPSPNLTISSVGPLGESRGAQPVLPPGGGLAIAAVGRARWEVEWAAEGKIWDMTAEEVERKGTRAVLRCPVGWSGDHRVLEGAELIAFTESWKKYVEEPWRWIEVNG